MELDILGMGSRLGLDNFEQIAMVVVLATAFFSLIYAAWLRKGVLKKDKGTEKMQEVWNAIRVGADAYLSKQLRTILPFIVVMALALFLSVYRCPANVRSNDDVP